jgi:hypothetical protein
VGTVILPTQANCSHPPVNEASILFVEGGVRGANLSKRYPKCSKIGRQVSGTSAWNGKGKSVSRRSRPSPVRRTNHRVQSFCRFNIERER